MDIQLELNLDDKAPIDVCIDMMQRQINAMNESMGKVRRRLFAEMGELKKMITMLQQENDMLKNRLNSVENKRTEWIYSQDNELFKIRAG